MLPKEPADLSLMHEAARQVEVHRTFADRSQKEPIPTEEEIREILKKTGKMTPEQELNCGACGYPTAGEGDRCFPEKGGGRYVYSVPA